MKLLLIRHGHPDYRLDCLTKLGHAQAEQVRKRLENEKIDSILSSSCGRAYETALHVASPRGMEVTKSDSFRELSWGPVEGSAHAFSYSPWDQAVQTVRDGLPLDESAPLFLANTIGQSVRRVAEGIDGWLSTVGYPREGAYYRCERASNDTVALFAHAGAFTALLSHVLNVPFPQAVQCFHLEFTSVSALYFDVREGVLTAPRLTLLNDARHIECIESPAAFDIRK